MKGAQPLAGIAVWGGVGVQPGGPEAPPGLLWRKERQFLM